MIKFESFINSILYAPVFKCAKYLVDLIARYVIKCSIVHLSGPRKLNLSDSSLVVLCLVKDGELVVEDFIDYYLSLGVDHIVFLDNGSKDRTAELASRHEKTTVLRTYFPFRNGGDARLREFLTYHYGFGVWSLCVDIDEYFDFPYSDEITIKDFIDYLNSQSYTAVITQMIDMFPAQLYRGKHAQFNRDEHQYYLLDHLLREKYKIWEDEKQASSVVGVAHVAMSGGIRRALFGATPSLTKHALILRNAVTRRDRWGHFLDKGVVADVSAVLRHYKFTSAFFNQVEAAVCQENHFKKSLEYKQYYEVLKELQTIQFPIAKAARWNGINQLTGQGLVSVSDRYRQWCNFSKQNGGRRREL